MLAYTQVAGAQIAFMNPGGIRAEPRLRATPPAARRRAGDVRRGLHGAAVQQPGRDAHATPARSSRTCSSSSSPATPGRPSTKFLQVSDGFTYTYDTTRPLGSRVSALALNGTPIDPAATYRVTTNDFLANGGDGFTRPDRRHRPGHGAGLRRRLAGGVPRHRPDRARPGEPDHQDRLSQEALPPQAARGAADGECRGHTRCPFRRQLGTGSDFPSGRQPADRSETAKGHGRPFSTNGTGMVRA